MAADSATASSLSDSDATASSLPDTIDELSFFPIRNPGLIQYYQDQKDIVWAPAHIDFSNDRSQFERLDPSTQKYIKNILFLFAQLDGIICENLTSNFQRETAALAKECGMFYAAQLYMEVIHNETYSLLIKTFIRDPEEQTRGFTAIRNYPAIRKIAEFVYSWFDDSIPLEERVIAFACVEGIIFSSAFAGVYWIKRMNVLQGLTKSNEWIARDEALHTRFAVALYHHLTSIWQDSRHREPVAEARVREIISGATEVCAEFTRNAMECSLVGINAEEMVNYVKWCANGLGQALGYSDVYPGATNSFDWMVVIGLPNKSNFFEVKVTEYSNAKDGDLKFDLGVRF